MCSLIPILLLFSVLLFMPTLFKGNDCKASGNFFSLVLPLLITMTNALTWLQSLLIFLTGDVEANPRAKPNSWGNVSICHWNFTSLPALIYTAQKMKFSIKDFFSKYDQIRSHLLKKSLMENFIFCAVLCESTAAESTCKFS